MSAYAPRHAAPPRLTPVLLAALDAAVLAVAVLALALAVLAVTRTPGPAPAALSAPVPAASAPAAVHPGRARVTPLPTHTAPDLPYVVQRGDTLWSVSAWYYGTGGSWPRIWTANRAVVGSNPGMIRPGEKLVFP